MTGETERVEENSSASETPGYRETSTAIESETGKRDRRERDLPPQQRDRAE